MITLPELLEDPKYKAYFCRKPELPAVALMCSTPPWQVHLRYGRKWEVLYADTYVEAFKALKPLLPEISDGAIVCKRFQSPPPMRIVKIKGKYKTVNGVTTQETKLVPWKPKLPMAEADHYWCGYCRRPTVFAYFSKHHALGLQSPGVPVDSSVMRCSICGASERLVTLR
jgi:hypothetical protein